MAVQTINNNNINNSTFTNHFNNRINNYNSYSKIDFNKTSINNLYNSSNLSLNNTYINRNAINSPKLNRRFNNKTLHITNYNNTNKDNISNNVDKKDINFNLNDLFIFEDRINDIVSAFNKTNNIYDIEASNECNEFINFYSKSSLKGIFPTFFKDNNKLIYIFNHLIIFY